MIALLPRRIRVCSVWVATASSSTVNSTRPAIVWAHSTVSSSSSAGLALSTFTGLANTSLMNVDGTTRRVASRWMPAGCR